MADGYYARPADVKAEGNRYLVTMTIRTKKNLSPYPVKVLSINGQAPFNVRKLRHGSDYDYQYSFYAKKLDQPISSKISIDVPNVYQATHDASFQFDNSNLAKLSASGSKKDSSEKGATAVNKVDSASPDEFLAQARSQSLAVKKKQQQLAEQKLKQNEQNRLDNERNQRMFYYTIFGGVLSLIALIIGAVFFVLGVKKEHK